MYKLTLFKVKSQSESRGFKRNHITYFLTVQPICVKRFFINITTGGDAKKLFYWHLKQIKNAIFLYKFLFRYVRF